MRVERSLPCFRSRQNEVGSACHAAFLARVVRAAEGSQPGKAVEVLATLKSWTLGAQADLVVWVEVLDVMDGVLERSRKAFPRLHVTAVADPAPQADLAGYHAALAAVRGLLLKAN